MVKLFYMNKIDVEKMWRKIIRKVFFFFFVVREYLSLIELFIIYILHIIESSLLFKPYIHIEIIVNPIQSLYIIQFNV